MTVCIFESGRRHQPRVPDTVEGCDANDYDFQPSADQAYAAINAFYLTNLIENMPFNDPEEVHDIIRILIGELDLDNPDFQTTEKNCIRVQYLDYMLGVEVVLGV